MCNLCFPDRLSLLHNDLGFETELYLLSTSQNIHGCLLTDMVHN